MAGPLVETKLHVPKRWRGLVARPRLSQPLRRGMESKLTLVSAPAGSGKTTLLAEWVTAASAGEWPVAWLSLDENDNEAALFWAHVITALQAAMPGIGASALSLLESPELPPMQTVLAMLLNELGAAGGDVVLVLDDYHDIHARDIQGGMVFLIDHLPSQIHLVIASRVDPALPLARLRGRGELVEIRAADLRFTPEEAAAYLNEVMGLALAAADVAALEARTEGWAAALQLAALSLQGRDDASRFISQFAGDDRYIVDYLVEEVLARQPEHVRAFLLQTSILSRLGGALCEAVTGRDGGQAMLEALERGNLFVVPLDERRRWYRYHRLFADVLHARLLGDRPDRVPQLHQRASAWHAQHGDLAEAIRHALAAGDYPRAADLVELAIPAARRGRQEATVRAWLESLPGDLIGARPVLAVAFAWALLVSGELDGVETRLEDAERWLDAAPTTQAPRTAPPAGMVVVDEEEFRRLPGVIAVLRAARAQALGDVAETMKHARRVLEVAADDDDLLRGSAAGFLGLGYWASGDLEAGHRMYAECAARVRKAGHLPDVLGCTIALADIQITQGRLREAMSAYERSLELATGHSPVLRGAADMYVGMSELLYERNDLRAAERCLARGRELGEHAGLPQNPYRWRVAMARVREAGGDLDGALELLDEAERVFAGDFFPNVRPIPALRARVWAAQGRFGDALGWARGRGLTVDDDLSYLREFEHITLARVLLARPRAARGDRPAREALGLLQRLLEAAEHGARTGNVITILVLQALAHQAQGGLSAALAPLERAVTLAEPEGYVRTFVDEGPAMAALLETAARHGIAPGYARVLRAAFAAGRQEAPGQRRLVEPLSGRELDVLRLLGTDLSGPDIARELVVSINTVRTHTKNIYAKLGVDNRRAAVRRAQELDLLPSSPHH